MEKKVKILQIGKNGNYQWCLISHPTVEHLYYRISLHWLSQNLPPEVHPSHRNVKQFPFEFKAMKKLVRFVQGISARILSVPHSDKVGEQSNEEKSGSATINQNLEKIT